MSRRWIGVAASVVLALVGALLLINYVQGADERALEGEETVEVLVVTEPVPRGTAVEDLEGKVERTLVPVKLQTPGSLGDLDALQGTFTAVDLVTGEQLLTSRFVSGDALVTLDQFPLPDEMLEFTLSLDPERALGGSLHAGDQVAVIASFDPFRVEEDTTASEETPIVVTVDEEGNITDATSGEPTEPAAVEFRTPSSTHILIHKALVTNVQIERLPTATDAATAEETGVDLAPTGNLLVSLAMAPEDVERTVFTVEFGQVWLARSSDTVPDGPTVIQTRQTIYLDTGVVEASIK